MSILKQAFKNIVTEPDNKTHCLVRWTALIGVIQGLGLQAYVVVWKGAPFDLQAFGLGLGAIIVAAGAAMGIKKDSNV